MHHPFSQRAAAVHGLAVALLLMVGCSSIPTPPPREPERAALQAGQTAARALQRGDLAQARQLYERALAQADAIEDFDLAGTLLLNLALVHQRQADRTSGDLRTAELVAAQRRLDRVLDAPQRYGGSGLQAAAATRRAWLHLDAGDAAAATAWVDRAQSLCASPCDHGATLSQLQAQLALQRADAAVAARHAEQALARATAMQQSAEQAHAWRLLGRARSLLGLHDQAAVDLAHALALDQRLGHPERIALDLVWSGDLALRRQQPASAREFYQRARVVAEAAGLVRLLERVRQRLDALPSG
jgi:tetratricopeptide (TPR) repeat protein